MKTQYYFKDEDSEICHLKEYFLREMSEEGKSEMEVFEAIRNRESGVFWCKEHSFCGDGTLDYCGKDNCKEYSPRNGKSGCCRHHTNWMYIWGEKVTLNIKEE